MGKPGIAIRAPTKVALADFRHLDSIPQGGPGIRYPMKFCGPSFG